MHNSILNSLTEVKVFWWFAGFCFLFLGMAIATYNPLPAVVPLAAVFFLFVVNNPKHLYFLFFFLLPFSIEVEFGGFGTDLPSEPLMLILSGLCLLLYLISANKIKSNLLTHPITLIIVLHIAWIAFTTLFSTNQTYSLKFLLAKFWYILPFYFLPLLLLKTVEDYKKLFSFLGLGLFISIAFVMMQHATMGFSFDSINKAVRPIYRNHVSYGIILICYLPFLWFLIKGTKPKFTVIKYMLLGFLLLAIYLTYTRAAQLAVVLSIGIYWVIKWRLSKAAIFLSSAAVVFLILFLSINNRYLDFAPDFNKTIEHKKFDNLMAATYKMEDISTVERFYRWVAGAYMLKEKPIVGFGPATFYSKYKSYTVTSYKTYVSNNPEKSGIHNYYLMTAVEQGVVGLVIFLLLAILPVFYGEIAYHKTKDKPTKLLIISAVVCFVLIDIVILINDLLEADKVGPFYFLSLAIITSFYIKSFEDKNLKQN